MKTNKRGMSAWIWILIILILAAIGVSAYFLLFGGNSIPQPPALPSG